MRKALVILIVAVLAAAAVDTLRDRTQNRADEAVAGSVSVVTFDVDTQRAPSRSPSRRGRSGTRATRRSPTSSSCCASATAATAWPPCRHRSDRTSANG